MLVKIKPPPLIPRDALCGVWDKQADEIVAEASNVNRQLGDVLNQLSPPTRDDPGDAVARILMEKGVQFESSAYSQSTRLKDFGYTERGSEGRLLFDEYLDNRFRWVIRNMPLNAIEFDRPVNERSRVAPRLTRALSQTDAEKAGGQYWDPRTVMGWIRKEQFGPSANYRDLVYDVQTAADKVELPKLTVPKGARRMQPVARRTKPEMSSASFEAVKKEYTRYRGGIEYDDDFFTNDNARVEVIEDFVMQFAEDFLIQLLHLTAKTYAANVSDTVVLDSANTYAHGTAHVNSTLTLGEWDDFANSFDEPYRPNRAIGNKSGYRAMRDIYQPEQITLGMRRQSDPESTPEFYSLNSASESVGCAFIQGTDAETGLGRPSGSGSSGQVYIVAFNRNYSGLSVFFKMGRDQDEMNRDAGMEITERFLGTSVMFLERDTKGIKGLVA